MVSFASVRLSFISIFQNSLSLLSHLSSSHSMMHPDLPNWSVVCVSCFAFVHCILLNDEKEEEEDPSVDQLTDFVAQHKSFHLTASSSLLLGVFLNKFILKKKNRFQGIKEIQKGDEKSLPATVAAMQNCLPLFCSRRMNGDQGRKFKFRHV